MTHFDKLVKELGLLQPDEIKILCISFNEITGSDDEEIAQANWKKQKELIKARYNERIKNGWT